MKLSFAIGVAIVLRSSATETPSAAPSEAPTAAPTAAPSQSPTTHWEYRSQGGPKDGEEGQKSCDVYEDMFDDDDVVGHSAKIHDPVQTATDTTCIDRSGCQPLLDHPTVCCGFVGSDPSTRCGPYNTSNKCVLYQNDGANCPHPETHPIPRCQDIRTKDDTGHQPEPWFFCSAGDKDSSLNTAMDVGKCMPPEADHGKKCVNWAKWAFMKIHSYSGKTCQVNGLQSNVNCVSNFNEQVNIHEVKVKIGKKDFEVRCAEEFEYTPPESSSGATTCSKTFYVRLFDNRRPTEKHNDEYMFCAQPSTTDESSWRSTPFTPSPTTAPSAAPSEAPTSSPTSAPTTYNDTTLEPTAFPTGAPTGAPTSAPSSAPSSAPTGAPTSPTPSPTEYSGAENRTHDYLDNLRSATEDARTRMATYNQAVKDYPSLFKIMVEVDSTIEQDYPISEGAYSSLGFVPDNKSGKWEWVMDEWDEMGMVKVGNFSLQFFEKPEAAWWFAHNGVVKYPSHCPISDSNLPPSNSEECFPASQGITFKYALRTDGPWNRDNLCEVYEVETKHDIPLTVGHHLWYKADTDPNKACKVRDPTIEQDQVPVLSGRVKNATLEVKYEWKSKLEGWCPPLPAWITQEGWAAPIETAEECDYGLIPCEVKSEPMCSLCMPNAVNNSGVAPRFQVTVECDDTNNGGQVGPVQQSFQTTTCTAEDARSCANPIANKSGYVAGGMYNGSDVEAWYNASL